MQETNYSYSQGETRLQGYLCYDDSIAEPMPAVLVFHDWTGRNEFACEKARLLARMGYLGFAVDMYGNAALGKTVEEKMALMEPLVQDRALLNQRLQAAFQAVKAMPEVDENAIAALGFCFGGLCALDLARSAAPLKGVVSFHGLLNKPVGLKPQQIQSKVLVLHGYDDPMVSPLQVQEFCQEMTEAKVDWQVHLYGNTQHAFTNPEAHDSSLGTVYSSVAETRALESAFDFLEEVFS